MDHGPGVPPLASSPSPLYPFLFVFLYLYFTACTSLGQRPSASVPRPASPPPASGYPLLPPPQHPKHDHPPPPQHHAAVPAHHPPQHQPPHHYPAPPPQSVDPQHPPPHQYDYQQHYAQYPPSRYASAAYDSYPRPPPQPQSVPTYPSAAGYHAQYGRPGEPYGQYPPPAPGAASVYYAEAAPRGYGTPPPDAYPPAPYHAHPPPPATHHASPPGHYPPYPSHPPTPHQGTWNAPNYSAPAPGVYPGQSQNQNGTWENGAPSGGDGSVSVALRGPDSSRGDRQLADTRPDIKDDREPWNMRGHGLGDGAPPTSALGSMNRSDRSRKRLSIGTLLAEE